ncbi:MAG TPA: neutral/alkaline non-lysosomal ceramidase N-terminal domain-containing protein [Planctomycetota bacterium]|nr:neutral/alkaline non-lysosomal ceramidase N-terminal domain-containing protein [Planctomycetota bacterium]
MQRTSGRRRVVCSVVVACTIASCQSTASVAGCLPAPVARAGGKVMRGGAATVDITPEPGFPLGGHSIAGKLGRGTWTRLRARCLYLEDPNGSPLVLGACELWSISGSLSDRVAELVADDPAGRHIGRERIVLAATHTHHGPGAFTAHTAYAVNAARLAGFDPDLHEFLARRIAGGILAAARSAETVRLRCGEARLAGVQRNRSFDAFALDPDARAVLAENDKLPIGEVDALYPREAAWRAVDPAVRVLTMHGPGDRLIGAAAFVAVHPTAMRASTEVYHGDLFGVAAIEAEVALRGAGHEAPVIALFNGAEGDVSPFWRRQDRADVVANGNRVAQAVVAAARAGKPIGGANEIAGAFARVPLAAASWHEEGVPRATAAHAVPGAAQLGGAEDGRTFLFDLGWVEGVRGIRHQGRHTRGHGVKLPALEPSFDLEGMAPFVDLLLPDLTAALADPSTFPREVPLGVYRVGDRWFATLPGEFTLLMGRRAANAIAARIGVQHSSLHLIGLANEYASYFATPQEYEAQHYEGASTLYGPWSGPWIVHQLAALAADAKTTQARTEEQRYGYSVTPRRRFGLHGLGEPPVRHDDGLDSVLVDGAHVVRRDLPHVEWTAPRGPGLARLGDGDTAMPFVRVRDAQGTLVADANGLELVTVALAATDTDVRWSAIWLAEKPPVGQYTFFVAGPDGSERLIGSLTRGEEPGR